MGSTQRVEFVPIGGRGWKPAYGAMDSQENMHYTIPMYITQFTEK